VTQNNRRTSKPLGQPGCCGTGFVNVFDDSGLRREALVDQRAMPGQIYGSGCNIQLLESVQIATVAPGTMMGTRDQ